MAKNSGKFGFLFEDGSGTNGRTYVIISDGECRHPRIPELGMDYCIDLAMDSMVQAPYVIFSEGKWFDPRRDMELMPVKASEPCGYDSLEKMGAIELTPDMAVEVPPRKSIKEAGFREWLDYSLWDIKRQLKQPKNGRYPGLVDFNSVEWVKLLETREDIDQSMWKAMVERKVQPARKIDYVDASMAVKPLGKAGEFSGSVRIPAAKADSLRKKRMLLQKKAYSENDLEDAKGVFAGCPKRMVAEQVMRIRDVGPAEAAGILPYLDASFSLKELEWIYSSIPEGERHTIENVRSLQSKEYVAHLEGLKRSLGCPSAGSSLE